MTFMSVARSLTMAGALTAAAALSLTGAAQAQQQFIAIGTGGPTGVYFVVGNAICRMVHKEAAEGREAGRKHGLRCAAPSTAGSIYNINSIRQDELEFGVAQSDWQYHAFNGTSRFEDNPFPEIRAVFSVHPEPFQILAAQDSGIESWEDLEGKRVNIGNPGSGQRGTFEVLMEAHGIDESWFGQTTELTSTEQSGALCDGNIDAYGYTVGVPNSGVAQAADGCGAYIIDLQTDAVTKLVEDNPCYAFTTTSADVPENVVYEVTRAVFENLEDFRKLHPAFANLTPEQMISKGISADIHPGAMKYYKEKGWM